MMRMVEPRAMRIWAHDIGEEYGESSFGGFGDYMRRKKLKLQNQDEQIRLDINDEPQIFKGMVIHVSTLVDAE